MEQLREANERLIVAAVHAQDVSDEALAEAERARSDLNDLMSRLRDTNELAAAVAAHAQAMAEEARTAPGGVSASVRATAPIAG